MWSKHAHFDKNIPILRQFVEKIRIFLMIFVSAANGRGLNHDSHKLTQIINITNIYKQIT